MKESTKEAIARTAMVVVYLLLGAAVFYGIEKNQARSSEGLEAYVSTLQRNLSPAISTDELKWLVERIRADYRCVGAHSATTSYYSSLCLCFSVITTTGYGYLAPRSGAGRIFCVLYAAMGIPLTLLTLMSVGERFRQLIGQLVTFISRKVTNRRPRQKAVQVMVISAFLVACILLIGGPLYLSEGWSFSESVYYCFIALSTIGFGDLVPRDGGAPTSSLQSLEVVVRGCYVVFGLSLVSTFVISLMSAAEQFKCTCHLSKKKGGSRPEGLPEDYLPEEDPGMGPRFDGLYGLSRGVEQVVFPSVIPFRRFTSDESMPLSGDPRWFY